MSRNRFIGADIVRLDLSDGDWIEVKKDLNVGDQKKLEAAGLKSPVRQGTEVIAPIDWAVYEIERAAIFLTDWSFRDAEDKPVPLLDKQGRVSLDTLKSIEPSSFEEINTAIFKYVIERAKEKDEAKKSMRAAELTTQPLLAQEVLSS